MDIRRQFGAVLKAIRTSKGLTQEEVAFRAGMSVPYLSEIERGKSAPSLVMIVDLAIALETHPVEMFKELHLESAPSARKRPKED